MNLGRWLVVAMVSALAVGVSAQAKNENKVAAAPQVRSQMLVSTEWLAQHLDDPKVIVVHVGGSKQEYENGHIPGARWLATDKFIRNEAPGNELPTNENLRHAFEELGIGDTARVVLYGNDSPLTAARAYFTLDYVGHGDRAALLDGGIEKWLMEKRAVSRETPTFAKADFTVTPNPKVLATREQVERLVDTAILIDARPLAQYRTGHIAGASPMYWKENLVSDASPMLSPPEDLRRKLEMAGVTPAKETVVYCNSGMQSSFAYFVAKYLGYDVINYDGSMNEWKAEKNAMVQGDAKR